MPSKSPAQHAPPFAKKAGAPQPASKEYVDADKMRAQAHALRKRKPVPKVPDADGDME